MTIHLKTKLAAWGAICLSVHLVLPILLSAQKYTPISPSEISFFLGSGNRSVISLAGEWEQRNSDNEWERTTLPKALTDGSRVTYRKRVNIDPAIRDNYSWQLFFLGLNEVVELKINNQSAESHFGGMSPFMLTLPDKFVNAGMNVLEITVSGGGGVNGVSRKFAQYGAKPVYGVIREFFLVGTPRVWVSDVRFSSQVNLSTQSADVSANFLLSSGFIDRLFDTDSVSTDNSERQTFSVSTQLTSPDGVTIASGDPHDVTIGRERSIRLQSNLHVSNPALWSLSSPKLYNLRISVSRNGRLIDDLTSEVGIRSVGIGTTNQVPSILLNGESIQIRCVDYKEHCASGGFTVSTQQFDQDVSLIKNLGVNAVRLKDGAPHPYFVQLCNRNGIMIFCGLPVSDVPANLLDRDEYSTLLKNTAERALAWYERQPSIVAWGLSHGLLDDDPRVRQFQFTLSGLVRASSDKLLYKSFRLSQANFEKRDVDFYFFDVEGIHVETNALLNTIRQRRNRSGNVPAIFSFSSAVQVDNINGFDDPQSLQSQARFLRDAFHGCQEIGVAGTVLGSFADYEVSSPFMIADNDDQSLATFGLLDVWRHNRISYRMVKALYTDEKEPLLQPGGVVDKTQVIYVIAGVAVIIFFVLMLNSSRRFREYVSRALFRPYNFFADIRDQRLLSRVQTLLLGVVISFSAGMILSAIFLYARSSPTAEFAVNIFLPQENLKWIFNSVVWNSELAMLVFSLLYLGWMFLVAAFLGLCAVFVPGRIFFMETLAITVWSALPYILLLPLSLVLYRALGWSPDVVWAVVVLILMNLWILYRTLKATAIVFDFRLGLVYAIGLAFTVVAGSCVLLIWNQNYETISYARHFFAVILD